MKWMAKFETRSIYESEKLFIFKWWSCRKEVDVYETWIFFRNRYLVEMIRSFTDVTRILDEGSRE